MTRFYNVKLEFPGHPARPVKWKTQDTSLMACKRRLQEVCQQFYGNTHGRLKITVTPKGNPI